MLKELTDVITESRKKSDSITSRLKIGFHLVVIALLLFLTVMAWNASVTTHNLSEVINRRSPVIEYLSCYNARNAANNIAVDELVLLYTTADKSVPESADIQKAADRLVVTGKALKDANDANSDNPCPHIPNSK